MTLVANNVTPARMKYLLEQARLRAETILAILASDPTLETCTAFGPFHHPEDGDELLSVLATADTLNTIIKSKFDAIRTKEEYFRN